MLRKSGRYIYIYTHIGGGRERERVGQKAGNILGDNEDFLEEMYAISNYILKSKKLKLSFP